MPETIKYKQIPDTGDDHVEGYEKPVERQRPGITALISFLVGLLTMGLIAACFSIIMLPARPVARILPEIRSGSDPITGLPISWSHGDCGNSPEEARAQGCRYSIVLHAWLPKSCLAEDDEEDTKDMYNGRNWPLTAASGQNLTMEEFSSGDYGHFVTTFDWHVTHCMYVWKRLHRVMLDPTKELDSYTANYHHTSHCVKMIGGDAGGMKDSGTKVFVKYPKCAK
ncbi:Ff.00g017000.m01.CDS01 [Fusarium sp. VM40]|nr:Ff.00g017000.m01.CDS01 [Fusarium sp. VM40]